MQNSTKRRIFKIKGMDCPSCATLIECELEDAKIKAKVNFAKETIEIEIDKEEKTRKIVKKLGYLIK